MRIPDEIIDLSDLVVKKLIQFSKDHPDHIKRRGDPSFALDSYMLGVPESEYATHMKSKHCFSCDVSPPALANIDHPYLRNEDCQEILQLYDQICTEIGASYIQPLLTYYPAGGYIGWHHNADSSGQNIFINWSRDGGGVYKTWNNLTREFEYFPDNKGWTIKSHNYRGWDEVEEKGFSWHAMTTESPRVSIALIIPEFDSGLGDMIREMFDISGSPSINGVYCEGAN